MASGKIRVGLSGWSYRHWRSAFYPGDLPAREQFSFVAEHFDSVEINRSFYSLVNPGWYRTLYERSPEQFSFAVKGSRFITHMKKLRGTEIALANFVASGILELGEKLGPLLWQLPANFPARPGRLQEFFEILPHSHESAAKLASKHQLQGREVSTEPRYEGPIQHALEIRNAELLTDDVLAVAREKQICLVASHSSRWPYLEIPSTDFMYLRLHGPRQLYASSYTEGELRNWAERVVAWQRSGWNVFVYFDNDGSGYAPTNALRLLELLTAGDIRS
jgi:uncharacterized protein YecE (DUF72 family)